MKQKEQFKVIICFFLFSNHFLWALSVGSQTVPSRQGYVTFPSNQTNNVMIGYTAFENGFKCADNATSVSFDGLLPVSGTIDFNGGKLFLMESLTFGNTTKINSMGSIYGNGKSIIFSSSLSLLQSTESDLMVTLTRYNGSRQINSVDFTKTSSYLVFASNNITGASELRVTYFDGYGLTLTASREITKNALSCRWQPGTTNCVVGVASGTGAELFSYQYNVSNGVFGGVSALSPPGNRSINAVSFSPGGNYLLIGRQVIGSTQNPLFMYSVTSGGVLTELFNQAFPGTIRDVPVNAISWSPGGNYLAVGTTVAAASADLLIYYFNGTTLTPTIQMITGRQVRGVDWSPSGTFIAVALVGTTTQNLHIFAHDISSGSLQPQTSAYINQTTDVISVAWSKDGNELAVGTALVGGRSAMRKYSFNSTLTTLSLVKSFTFYASVNALGSFEYNNNYVMGVGNDLYVLADTYFDGYTLTIDSLTVELQNDLLLQTPLGFSRNCSIMGNHHAIDFDVTGTMVILPKSRLYLKDLTLRNFGGTQLRCLDNTATISLDNVTFQCKSPYYFNAGSLQIFNQFTLSGTNPFIYQSSVGSQINKNSTWLCDYLSTFSYAPTSNNRYGIQMNDQSSTFMMRNATLYSSSTGLLFTAGTLLFEGTSVLKSDGTSFAEAIQWGDGLTFTNDVKVIMMPGAQLDLQSGYLVDQNLIL
jgi:WD40 repeat protein